MGLDLHEVVVPAEDLLVPPGRLPRPRDIAGAQVPGDLGVQAPREHQQPVGVLCEELVVDPGLVVVALEVRPRDELDEVLVAGPVAHEDREVVGALVAAILRAALLAAARRDVELAADDRLDAGLLGRQVEIDRAEQIPVVGQRDRREAQLLRLLDELLELGGAVEQAVLGVNVQVDEVAMLHRWSGYSLRLFSEPLKRRLGRRTLTAYCLTPTRSWTEASTRCRRPRG